MKRIGILFLALVMFINVIGGFAVAADSSGSPKHIPRIVSVVFDTSGSMENAFNGPGGGRGDSLDKWAYASYAMQTFISMMSNEDELYVTKLSANPSYGSNLLNNKSSEIKAYKDLKRTDFSTSTYNGVDEAAKALTDRYKKYGADAKYYLVVIADGQLDSGSYEDVLSANVESVTKTLDGAEFETIFFGIGLSDDIKESINRVEGVDSRNIVNSSDIVNTLKNISADIMGRNEIDSEKLSENNGNIEFDLEYPALSITVFAQKNNVSFDNVSFTVTRDGQKTAFDYDTHTVQCTSDLVEEGGTSQVPAGFVSILTNNGKSMPKGRHSVDLSAYGISVSDVVILVEPAVKIGCKYFVGDSPEPKTFDQIKNSLRAGQELKIQCALYEMNDDGSLGEEVSDSVLSPDFELRVNNRLITDTVPGEKNMYRITMTEDMAGKDLEVKASVEPYQPFAHRETFVSLALTPVINKAAEDISLTKPVWQQWCEGKGKITFSLANVDSTLLNSLEIRFDGYDKLPSGICSDLKDNLKVKGGNLTYIPEIDTAESFESVPESFKIALCDTFSGEIVDEITVSKVNPQYKFEIKNELEGEKLTPVTLTENDKKITFTVLVDYDGNGAYIPVDKADYKETPEISVETGILSGEVDVDGGKAVYTPSYDKTVNSETGLSKFGEEVTVYATAKIGSQTIESDKVTFKFSTAKYKLVASSEITDPLTLDSIKHNKQKIVFTLLADYEDDGVYSELAAADTSANDIRLDTGAFLLPGKSGVEYSAGGNPVGIYFIPEYDENSTEKPFTEVAGKTHEISASYAGEKETVKIEVLSPTFDVSVKKELVEVLDYGLCENTDGVEFTVSRDGRILSVKELEGLMPYDISLDKNQKKVVVSSVVKESADGTGYIVIIPTHKNKSIFTRWLSFFVVHGETTVTLAAGNDSDSARIDISRDSFAVTVHLIVLLVILIILYLIFCFATLIMFPKGRFYTAVFTKAENRTGYNLRSYSCKKANPLRIKAFIRGNKQDTRRETQKPSKLVRIFRRIWEIIVKIFPVPVPFMTISRSVTVNRNTAKFVTRKDRTSGFIRKVHPYFVINGESCHNFREYVGFSRLIDRVLANDKTLLIRSAGKSFPAITEDVLSMKGGTAISHHDERTNRIYVIFYLTQKEIKKITKSIKEKKAAEKSRTHKR